MPHTWQPSTRPIVSKICMMLTGAASLKKPCHDENAAFEILVGAAAITLPGLLAKLAYLRAIAEGREAWMLDEREGTALDLINNFTQSIQSIWEVRL
jgi:hypothetical protein